MFSIVVLFFFFFSLVHCSINSGALSSGLGYAFHQQHRPEDQGAIIITCYGKGGGGGEGANSLWLEQLSMGGYCAVLPTVTT